MLAVLASAGLLGAGAAASATSQAEPDARPIHIVEIKGRIDPLVADFVARSLRSAVADDAEVVVLQINSPGALLDDQELAELVFRISHSPVPVAVWVGPTGARAYGGAADVVTAAATAGMAPRTRIGRFEGVPGSLGPEEARTQGAVDTIVPTIGEFLAELDERDLGGRVLDTARVVTGSDGESQTQAAGAVRFAKLPLTERLLHAAASPSVAYLLLIVGLSLIVFEFFSVGIGVAGATGAVLLALSAYGLGVLPTTPLGLALIGLSMFGFGIDVQAGSSRAWTVIATVALLIGSLTLFGDGIDVPWLTLLVLVVCVVLLMVSGLPSMVRSRFSTPTIGRESMIGAMGEARTAVDPEGTVALGGGLWQARTNRATPIGVGDPIRVVAIDGLLLEVEPEEGGAKDAGH